VYKSSLKNKYMRTKTFLKTASLAMFIAIALPASSSIIVPASSKTNNSAKTEDSRPQQLLQRLQDIKSMNKSELTRTERKELRNEVKEIRKEARTISGGVYLSAGAIIIIILLLLLLL
jgi:predicted PurR-regulated permease PerM